MIPPKKSVQMMKPYNPPLEGRRGLVRLDFNENTLGPSPKVISAIKNAKIEEIASYPEYSKFRRKLSKFLGIKESQLAITNATDEAIKLVIDTFMEPGDEIIIPAPTFPMFRFYAELAGAKIKEVLYNKDLSFPTEQILGSISKKTKIIVIVNPNSPTGTIAGRKDIIKIIEKAKNSIILLDEAYYQFLGSSCKSLVNDYSNLVVTQTFAKAFGLAGLRLGYIISNEGVIKSLQKASSPYSVNTLAIIAGSAAIDDMDYVKNYVEDVNEAKKILETGLKKLNIKIFPSGGNFILADFKNEANEIEKKLKQKGILVRSQSEKPLLKGCIRITIGTKEQINALLRELKGILK